MDARVKQVREILAAPGDQYLVPFFQRHYSWRRTEWLRLWSDLEQLVQHGDGASQHFLGPLVCTPIKHVPGEVTAYLLIDGQQRLTTITLMLAALRDLAEDCGLGDLAEEITEEYLIHKRQKKLNRYRLLPRTGDREILIGIIKGERKGLKRPNSLLKARRFFHRKIREFTEEAEELGPALQTIFNAVRNRLSLVVITIDGENPYEIFESLNSTGLPLEQSDLIRNYVFMQVPLDQQEDFNDEQWQPLEELFESPPLRQTRFYRHYLMRDGRYSLKNATFVDFKDLHRQREISPVKLVEELREYAQYERWLIHPKTCESAKVRRALEQLEAVDASTAHSLAMTLLARHQRGDFDESVLVGCIGDLVSFVLRRSMCGENTRTYSRWFVEAITKLGDSPRQGLQAYLLSRGWPDDDAFKSALSEFSLYRRERSKARMMLEELEREFGHKEQVELDDKLSIEHVLPQTVGDNDYGMEGDAGDQLGR